jgi:hypothetical protein
VAPWRQIYDVPLVDEVLQLSDEQIMERENPPT